MKLRGGRNLDLFELGWYSGNIYAPYPAPQIQPEKKEGISDLLEKEDRFAVGITFQDKQLFLSFRYVF